MKYLLNPFAMVAETEDAFIVCTADRLQVRLPKHNKPLIDHLVSGSVLTQKVLEQYVSRRRLDELVEKRLILSEESPPLDGRYSRQLGFFSLTSADFQQHQSRIAEADVLILGAGALGSHIAWTLAAIGVGRLTIVDFDTVEETNLNRQLMYTPDDIGSPKVEVLCQKLQAFNPQIEVTAVNLKIRSAADIERLIDGKTVLVKAIDTPEESTAWVNEVCVNREIPFITGGFLDYIGVVGPMYLPGHSICFACLESGQVKRLHGTGPTFAPLVTIVCSMMSMCIYRMIVGEIDTLVDKLITFDSRSGVWQTTDIMARSACKLCGHPPATFMAPKNPMSARLWFYRASILSMMCAASAIIAITQDRYIGILVFLGLFASFPALDSIVAGDPEKFRREAFIITCFYCIANVFFVGLLGLRGLHFAFGPFGLAQFFNFVQQACAVVIETVIAITVLFYVAIGYMGLIKRIANRT